MQIDEVTITPLDGPGELNEAAAVASRAFHFDPFFEYLLPHPLVRARGTALFFRAAVKALGPAGDVSVARLADGRIVGIAAWLTPNNYPLPIKAQLGELLQALRAMAPRPAAVAQGLKYIMAIDKAHPREELWYLLLLAVDPSVQRAGIGARLQQEVNERADRDGLACYLETQKEENLAYYRRFGYELEKVLNPVKDGPPLWTMRREPKSDR